MKKIFLLLSVLIVHFANAQIFTKPNNSYGTIQNRASFDSTMYFPTGCGTPHDTTSLFSQGTVNGSAQKLKKSTIYFDSCGHAFWIYDPSTKTWLGVSPSTIDTTSLSNRINLKLNISDTTLMLAHYLLQNIADTRYYPLTTNPAGYSILPNVVNSLQVINELGAPSIREDIFANRPVAGTAGKIFYATDTKVSYRDNGVSWDLIGGGSGVDLISSPLNTINFSTSGDTVLADVNISPNIGNTIQNNGGLFVPPVVSNGLLSGGVITWVTGYTYNISPAVYVINGVTYASPAKTVTLAGSDPALDRVDAIDVTVADTSGVITGIPNNPTIDPNINPASQYKIGNIFVQAATTQPATINQEWIYRENIEWVTAVSNARINAASTNNPFAGTKDVEATLARNADSINFTKSGTVTTANYNTLTFELRSKATWTNNSAIILHFASGVSVVITNGSFGFNSSVTTAYQIISIPLSAFGSLATTVGKLSIKVSTTGGRTIGFYIDDIQLQGASSIVPPPGNYVTNAGNAISLQSGLFTARPAAGVNGRFYAATGTSGNDSAFYFDNGSVWIPLSKAPIIPIIRVAYLGGTNGDSLVWANNGGDTLYSHRVRDSLGFHRLHNADGSITEWASGGTLDQVLAAGDTAFDKKAYFNNVAGQSLFTVDAKDSFVDISAYNHLGTNVAEINVSYLGVEITSKVNGVSFALDNVGFTNTLHTQAAQTITGDNVYFGNSGLSQDTIAYQSWVRANFASSSFTGLLFGRTDTRTSTNMLFSLGNHNFETDSANNWWVQTANATAELLVRASDSSVDILASTFIQQVNKFAIVGVSSPTSAINFFQQAAANYSHNLYWPIASAGVLGTDTLATKADLRGGGFGTGSVTSVATGIGLLGGTITTTGTLKADTNYLARWNDTTGTGTNTLVTLNYFNTHSSANVSSRTKTTVSANTTVVIPAGYQVITITVVPVSTLSAFQVGTTSTGNDVVGTQSVTSTGMTFNINAYFDSGVTLYFQGVSVSTKILTLQANLN